MGAIRVLRTPQESVCPLLVVLLKLSHRRLLPAKTKQTLPLFLAATEDSSHRDSHKSTQKTLPRAHRRLSQEQKLVRDNSCKHKSPKPLVGHELGHAILRPVFARTYTHGHVHSVRCRRWHKLKHKGTYKGGKGWSGVDAMGRTVADARHAAHCCWPSTNVSKACASTIVA